MIDKRNTLARHYQHNLNLRYRRHRGAVGGDGDDEDGHRG